MFGFVLFLLCICKDGLFLRICLVAEKTDGGKKKKIQCSSPFGLVFYFKVG